MRTSIVVDLKIQTPCGVPGINITGCELMQVFSKDHNSSIIWKNGYPKKGDVVHIRMDGLFSDQVVVVPLSTDYDPDHKVFVFENDESEAEDYARLCVEKDDNTNCITFVSLEQIDRT